MRLAGLWRVSFLLADVFIVLRVGNYYKDKSTIINEFGKGRTIRKVMRGGVEFSTLSGRLPGAFLQSLPSGIPP